MDEHPRIVITSNGFGQVIIHTFNLFGSEVHTLAVAPGIARDLAYELTEHAARAANTKGQL